MRIAKICLLLAGLVFCVPITHAQTGTSTKLVALTFDDGPYGESTQQVLAILHKERVPGTFFVIGKNVLEYPALTRAIVLQGNEIGNHTFDHTKRLALMSQSDVAAELMKTEAAIASETGVHTKLFRPPYGSLSDTVRIEAANEGYKTILWNVDPKDWDDAHTSSTSIERMVVTHIKPQMVILFHDGRDTHVRYSRANLISALPTVIEELRSRGYTFVTADTIAQ